MTRFWMRLALHLALCVALCVALTVACRDPGERFFHAGESAVDTGPLPRGITSLSAEACRGCHRSDFDDWQHSVHGQAWRDVLFQDSHREEPSVWCVNCHAPLKEQAMVALPHQPGIVDRRIRQSPATVALRDEGINCAACHLRDGYVLVSKKDRLAESDRHHAVRYEPFLKDSRFCAGCHQFNFPYFDPAKALHPGPAPMQNTYAEWRRSAASLIGIGCQECHTSSENHRIYGPHTPGWLEGKVSIEARLVEDSGRRAVQVQLLLRGIAHSFPTGDLFRGLSIEVVEAGRTVEALHLGRKTGDTEDPSAPNGMYKRFIAENVLRPEMLNPAISERLTIPIEHDVRDFRTLRCRVVYHFRNREAENPARKESDLRKVIADVPVREVRHGKR